MELKNLIFQATLLSNFRKGLQHHLGDEHPQPIMERTDPAPPR